MLRKIKGVSSKHNIVKGIVSMTYTPTNKSRDT